MQLCGINLGNWLVLEKWMQPELFAGTDAEDEWYLAHSMTREQYAERIRTHRREHITERDFLRIQAWGFNAVRIPVPYFIFGDRPPFIGCVEELDNAFRWAEKYGLKILIDLHTCPDSQNAFDNGGITGVCKWWTEPEEVEFELTVLERLGRRYGKRKGLYGIEILNEPVLEDMWRIADVQAVYPPRDAEMAAGSCGMTETFLREYYTRACHVLRKHMPEEKVIVIHDAFHFDMWKYFAEDTGLKNLALDTHMYLTTAEMLGVPPTVEGYSACIEKWKADIVETHQHIPVIVGEWCLAHNVETSEEEKQRLYRMFGEMQMDAWSCGLGHFYWSYKLMLDTDKNADQQKLESWDLERCIAHGWYTNENGGTCE